MQIWQNSKHDKKNTDYFLNKKRKTLQAHPEFTYKSWLWEKGDKARKKTNYF